MTDKSFGDHLNRGIVKNPLLLTAVTGLSIEDLTHNAVLLPAAPSQELIVRHDQQTGPQTVTLAHADRKNDNFPSGDANSNILHPNYPSTITPSPLDSQHNLKHDTNQNPLLSKASKKSDDDFDVNEYFARLQGTRYVSAPLNSVLKEDQKSSLDATEENLEEINLNEPDRVQNVEVQQSLTADIAQNFSQLPTVLPQVASAVFSSFSNMLSMKSREHTPDVPVPKTTGYQEVQFSTPEAVGVPLMGVDEPAAPKEVAPPPRELPIGGTSNYRITTKKKAYAQIPGLSSTHTVPNNPPLLNFPMDHSANFGLQKISDINSGTKVLADSFQHQPQMHISEDSHTISDLNQSSYTQGLNVFIPLVKPDYTEQLKTETQKDFNIFNPVPTEINTPQAVKELKEFVQENTVNLFTTVEQNQEQRSAHSTLTNASIIPPPPMFSNVPKKDSQVDARSVLPPSVARRIGTNNPIIKPQTLPPSSIPINSIFVPAPIVYKPPENADSEISNQSIPLESTSQLIQNDQSSIPPASVGSQSAFVQFNTPSPTAEKDVPRSAFPNFPDQVLPASSITNPTNDLPPVSVTSSPFQHNVTTESLSLNKTATSAILPPVNMSQSETPMFFNPSSLSSLVPSFPPMETPTTFQTQISDKNPLMETSSIIQPHASDQSSENLTVQPLLFNPNAIQHIPSQSNVVPETDIASRNFDQSTTSEATKIVPEPPKITGNLNYRMQKKRPQYYSGPIEGIGSISNNVKPTIPTIGQSTFQGSLFTPETQHTTERQPTIAFDSAVINAPTVNPGTCTQFDINTPQTQNYISTTQDYNTAFDMNLQTTENYTPPKEESKGFGIIGSLKSKLSSLDINKIQSTVTTFFDPAYNDTKKEPNDVKGNTPVSGNVSFGNQNNSSLEVFVPNLEQTNQNYIQNDYQTPYGYGQASRYYQNQSYDIGNQAHTYITPNQPSEYYQNPLMPYNYAIPTQSLDDTNTGNTILSPTQDFSNQAHAQIDKTETISRKDIPDIEIQKQDNIPGTSNLIGKFDNPSTVNLSTIADNLKSSPVKEDENVENANLFSNNNESTHQNYATENVTFTSTELKDGATFFDSQQFFNLSQPIQTADLNQRLENLQIAQEKERNASPDSIILKECIKTDFSDTLDLSSPLDLQSDTGAFKYFTNYPSQENKNAVYLQTPVDYFGSSDADIGGFGSSYFHVGLNYQEPPKEIYVKDDIPRIDPSAMPLFGLPNVLDITSDSITDIEYKLRDTSLFEPDKELETGAIFEVNSVIKSETNENKLHADDNEPSPVLNICETCREVNTLEEKETDDVTTHLIENITAPIQLSNPVIAPLRENAKTEEDPSFESIQCAEISHITVETMDTIQVQTATELLEGENSVDNMQYGWKTSDDTLFLPTEVLLNNDYRFEVDAHALGFYGNNSFFFEDIPNNASDEIKAEFKSSHEETPVLLPRQMSNPTAPPAEEEEEDTKSDGTGGLDVHSIELDAKKDFPIFEEFVIEPSETDDDKIEYKERERSSDDPIQDIDTFTNRVERFKQMGETVDKDDDFDSHKCLIFDMNTAASPAVTFASYFDTGNYAADTHYRNSISSPLRIPPGFEEEYKRRMSGLSLCKTNDTKSDNDEHIPYIPDTTTQTKPIATTTYSMVSNINQDITVTSQIKFSKTKQEAQKLELVNVPQLANKITQLTKPTTKIINFAESAFDVTKLPISTPVISTEIENCPEITKLETDLTSNVLKQSEYAPAITKLSDLSTVFNQKPEPADNFASSLFSKVEDTKPTLLIASKTEEKAELNKTEVLADPISFFSSNVETSANIEPNNISFNRLASYFATPAKTDHGKSFFELSQSQNHYRHANNNISLNRNTKLEKSVTDPINLYDIPADVYLANLKLMNDLTSSKNIVINPNDQIVKTVNYFTVEYDNDVEIKNGTCIGEPDLKKLGNDISKEEKENAKLEDSEKCDDTKIMMVVTKCKFCCNNDSRRVITLNKVALDTDFKVRKAMDNDNDSPDNRADGNAEIDQKREDRRKEVTVTFGHPLHEESEGVAIMSESATSTEYTPVKHHWFYRVDFEGKSIWRGFSAIDNRALEDAFVSTELNETTAVATDGGRFDVNIVGRLRTAVYWSDKPTNVRRCSWFYKGTTDARYVPYTEAVADKLEEEYRRGVTTGEWHRRLVLPSNELVVMHGPAVMVHFPHAPDAMGSPPLFAFGKRVYRNPPKIRVARDQPKAIDHLLLLVHGAGEYRSQKEKEKFQSTMRPRVVRRGCDESEIEDPEPSNIDHLLLLCHGVGSACDMRFRSVEEVVDDFRATSLQLLQSHYRNSYDKGVVSRVEVLPISWHATLHSGETGVDRRLSEITLDSIPRLRNFTNDTVLDVLFYTSPVFCQTIIDTVCAELNRIHSLFLSRNPGFAGRVSLGGHSLGSVILYDLLCHQEPKGPSSGTPRKSFVEGAAGAGAVNYPALAFSPAALYALGSPIAMFECIRGVKSLGAEFALPTCSNFFNIFHPYDPIAYRIEPLINSQLGGIKPFLIPHHKGRKRMHLELKDTMARVGADLKQKLIESLKSTWTNMWRSQPPPNDGQLEKVVEEEIEKEQLCEDIKEDVLQNNDLAAGALAGRLNSGRRVDYVLQEAPLEMINEYLFAMSSHVCYWESEDTMLLILREIYDALDVQPDCTVPQQSMTVQRTRPPRTNETYIVSTSECPSTSRDST